MKTEITKKRLLKILDNLFTWAVDHDQEFYECFIAASGITSKELNELGGNIIVEGDKE